MIINMDICVWADGHMHWFVWFQGIIAVINVYFVNLTAVISRESVDRMPLFD